MICPDCRNNKDHTNCFDWWNAETHQAHADGSWKVPPYDNFYIGSDPTKGMTLELASQFNVFINVDDKPCGTFSPPALVFSNGEGAVISSPKMYYYPINEWGNWGYGPFFWSKQVLDFHHAQGHKIYLHCAAGMHRSPMIFMVWLLSRGHKLKEAAKMTFTNKHEAERMMYQHRQDILGGHIPANLDELHRRMDLNPNQGIDWILTKPTPISDSSEVLAKHQINRIDGGTS